MTTTTILIAIQDVTSCLGIRQIYQVISRIPLAGSVARPLTDCTLDVGVESHDRLYRNPFASPLAPHELKPGIATPLKDVP